MLAAATVTAMVLVTVPVTWARNSEWADELTLFEAEYARANRSSYLLRLLTAAHLRAGNFDRVIAVCAANPRHVGKAGYFNAHCASAFSYSGRQVEAEKAYLLAAQDPQSRVLAYSNLAQHYLRQGRLEEARVQFENAVNAGETAAQRAYQRGYMMVHLYPQDRQKLLVARGHFEQALELNPRLREAQSWLNRLNSQLGGESAATIE